LVLTCNFYRFIPPLGTSEHGLISSIIRICYFSCVLCVLRCASFLVVLSLLALSLVWLQVVDNMFFQGEIGAAIPGVSSLAMALNEIPAFPTVMTVIISVLMLIVMVSHSHTSSFTPAFTPSFACSSFLLYTYIYIYIDFNIADQFLRFLANTPNLTRSMIYIPTMEFDVL